MVLLTYVNFEVFFYMYAIFGLRKNNFKNFFFFFPIVFTADLFLRALEQKKKKKLKVRYDFTELERRY